MAASNTTTVTGTIQEYTVASDGSLTATGTPTTLSTGTLVIGIGVLPVMTTK